MVLLSYNSAYLRCNCILGTVKQSIPIPFLFPPKPRKQPQRILPINRPSHPRIHLIPFKLFITPLRLNRRIREITPIQHPLPRRPLEQRIQYIRTPTQRRIEIKALRIFRNLLPTRRLLRQQPAKQRRAKRHQPPAQERQRPARVREDDFTRRELPLATADDEITGRARGLVRVIDDGLRELGARPRGRGRVARVDEDDSITLIELGPDGLKVFIAEILAVIRSEERDTVGLELIKRIFQRFNRSLDIRKAGQRAEETEFCRFTGANGCRVIVPFASEGAAGPRVAFGGGTCDFGARGRKGEDGG